MLIFVGYYSLSKQVCLFDVQIKQLVDDMRQSSDIFCSLIDRRDLLM